MSKDRTVKGVRTQHWFGMASMELARLGITGWELVPPAGRGHMKLVIRHDGRTWSTPVPSSERGGGDHKYIVNRIRKEFSGDKQT